MSHLLGRKPPHAARQLACIGVIALGVLALDRYALAAPSAANELYIPPTHGEDDAHAFVALPIEKRRSSLTASVIDFGRGRVVRARLRWDDAPPGFYWTHVRARRSADRGEYHLAVAVHGNATIRAVRIGKRDAEPIEAMKGADFVYVAHAGRYGVDIDRDGRADLAFASVCDLMAGPPDDQICSGYDWIVVRRVRNAWQPARACRPELTRHDEPCWRL